MPRKNCRGRRAPTGTPDDPGAHRDELVVVRLRCPECFARQADLVLCAPPVLETVCRERHCRAKIVFALEGFLAHEDPPPKPAA